MSIALIDQDCLNNRKDFFFDLDIMKLASYYKSKREVTKLLLLPSEYYQYTQTYFVKNRFDYKMFTNIFKEPRITYRGYAFCPDKYESMEPDIEAAPADPTIYDTYLKFNTNIAGRRIPKISSAMSGIHSRFSTDGESCNVPDNILHYKDSEILCLYDYNLFTLLGWKERLKDFKNFSLRLKFSPISDDIEDLKHILENYNIYNENHFILSGEINDETLNEIIILGSNHKDRIRVELLDNLDLQDKDLFYSQIIYALNTILALKHARTRIHAYIDPHNIDERTAYLNTIAYWSNRNHSDSSLDYFLVQIRKQNNATRKFHEMAQENEVIKYLLNVNPSEWRKTI